MCSSINPSIHQPATLNYSSFVLLNLRGKKTAHPPLAFISIRSRRVFPPAVIERKPSHPLLTPTPAKTPSNAPRYFRTGDLGRMEDKTFLRITGRIKEQYKLENGKYVVPGPIEASMTSSTYVTQVGPLLRSRRSILCATKYSNTW